MSTYYVINNQFTGSISATDFSTAAANLRLLGAKFNARKSGDTFVVKFAFCPDFLRTHLLKKYAPKIEARTPKRSWNTRAAYEAAMNPALAVNAPRNNKVRSANELPLNSPTLAPIPVVVPPVAVERRISNGNRTYYNCLTVKLDNKAAGFAVASTNVNYREPNYPGTSDIGPALATYEQILALTCKKREALASQYKVQGRSTLRGTRNKSTLSFQLLGSVKVTELN